MPAQYAKITATTAMLGAVRASQYNQLGLDISLNSFADFSHDQARSRAYRWGEDGIAGVSDTHGYQNIGFSFWNEEEYIPLYPAKGATDSTDPFPVLFSRNDYLACQILRATMARVSKKRISTWITLL